MNEHILYHGTTHDFIKVDVHCGKPYKDFGQGFYLTEVYDHAKNLALRNRRIEESRLHAIGNELQLPAYIYQYKFDPRETGNFKVKRFKTSDREWLAFVILNRMNHNKQHDYDLVIGPTANDDTRTSIRTVINAANGLILNDTALDLLLALLEPNNLPTQYYFGSDAAVKLLHFEGRDELI